MRLPVQEARTASLPISLRQRTRNRIELLRVKSGQLSEDAICGVRKARCSATCVVGGPRRGASRLSERCSGIVDRLDSRRFTILSILCPFERLMYRTARGSPLRPQDGRRAPEERALQGSCGDSGPSVMRGRPSRASASRGGRRRWRREGGKKGGRLSGGSFACAAAAARVCCERLCWSACSFAVSHARGREGDGQL